MAGSKSTGGIEKLKKAKPGYKLVKSLFGKYEEIPEEWEVKQFHEIIEILDGKRIPLSESEREIKQGSFPYYGASGIIDYIDDFIFDEKLLCLAEDGENLRSRVLPIAFTIKGKTWVNNHAHVLRVKIEHSFLEYFLNHMSLLKYVASTAIPKLNQKDMRVMPIICPTISEQQQIASILSNIDELISSYEKTIQTTTKLKKGLMQTLLTKGIGHKKFKKVQWLFGKESEIPETWEMKYLADISKIVDSLHITPSYSSEGIPMIRSTEIKYGNLEIKNALKVTKEVFEQFTKNHKPRKNDIVMSRVGTYFVTSFVNTEESFCVGQNTLVIHPKIYSSYLYYSLNSSYVEKQIEINFDRTTGQKTLSLKNIRNLKIFVPNYKEQQKIATILSSIHEKISKLESKKKSAESLKKGLMQKLLTGQIRVKT